MGLVDVHAHLTHPDLAADEEALVRRARAAGVGCIISNGLNPEDNRAVAELAARHPTLIRPAFGLYPVDAVLKDMHAMGSDYPRDSAEFSTEEGIAWVRDHAAEAFAIGEIGLDGYWVPEALWPKQEDALCQLVTIAMEADKPIIVHSRKRERRLFDLLRELGAPRVDWHCFGSKVKLARQIAEHGHYLSIPANARRSESFTRMLQTLPRDRVLLETDCPYLSPDKARRNEPAFVRGTAEYAAELWDTSLEEVEHQIAANFERLFGAPVDTPSHA